MNKILILSGLWILLSLVGAGMGYDRKKKDLWISLGAGMMIATPIVMIVWGIIWNF